MGIKYAVEFDLRKSFEESKAQMMWIKKMDNFIQERFPAGKLMNFGSHLNVIFEGWEEVSEEQVKEKMKEVRNCKKAPSDSEQS